MLKQVTENGVIHIFSDEGKEIRMKDTGRVFKNAYEPVDGQHHEYEEVEGE